MCASNSSVFKCFCLCFVALVQNSVSTHLGEHKHILLRGPGRNRRNKLFKSTEILMCCVCLVFACPCPAPFESKKRLREHKHFYDYAGLIVVFCVCCVFCWCFKRQRFHRFICLCCVAWSQNSVSTHLGEHKHILFRGPRRNHRNKLLTSTQILMFCVCLVFACPCPAPFESTNGLVEN